MDRRNRLWPVHEVVTGVPPTNARKMEPGLVSIAVALLWLSAVRPEVRTRYDHHENH